MGLLKRRQSGHALFVAMMIMVLVASAIALLATHYGFRARLASQEARRIHLVALVDAAVAESMAELDDDSSFRGVASRPFGDGTIASEIERPSTDRRVIVATSTYRGWTRQVRVQVRLHSASMEIETWSVVPSG